MRIFERTRTEQALGAPTPAYDLWLILAGAFGLVPLFTQAALAPPLALLRLILGLIYVLFAPGYCIALAIFPRRNSLSIAERLALSIGISAALAPLLVLVLNQTRWGIAPRPILLSLYLVLALASAVALLRRAWLPPEQIFLPLRPGRAGRRPGGARLIAALIGLLLLAPIGAAALRIPAPGTRLTEFYMLGPDHLAQSYPRAPDDQGRVTLEVGIVNQEAGPRSYAIEIWAGDAWGEARPQQIACYGPIALAAGERYEQQLSWQLPQASSEQRVELLLFIAGEAQPYRRLRLWLPTRP